MRRFANLAGDNPGGPGRRTQFAAEAERSISGRRKGVSRMRGINNHGIIIVIAAAVTVSAASPTGADTVTFQQGVSGYAGTQDTTIRNFNPDLNLGSSSIIEMNGPTTFIRRALVRFDNIIGTGPGQIPPLSRILSATLTMNVQFAQSTAGATMHRVLTDWNEGTLTWNNFGSGPGGQPDIDYASEVLAIVSLTTLGTRSFNVTGKIQDYVDGHPTFGWMFSGTSNLVGGFDSSESVEGDERPLLVVEFTPVEATIASFQQGVSGYAGTQDTTIRNFNPDLNLGSSSIIEMNGPTTFIRRALVRFDNIIGTGPGQIPPLSRILSATLTMNVQFAQSTAGATMHRVLTDWNEGTLTWNNFGSGPGGQPDIDYASEVLAIVSLTTLGTRSFNVTGKIQDYVDGHPTFGWMFSGTSNLVGGFDSSESVEGDERPLLVVGYLPPVNTCPADINTSGTVNVIDLLAMLAAWGACP